MPPPGFGPGGPGVPPAGGGGGRKTGLIIGIVVLVLVLAGLGGFLLLRGSDKKPVAVDTTTTTTAGTTTSESTTTTEEEGPTTTRRRPTTSSSSSSTTTSSRRSTTTRGGGEVSIEEFDAASAILAPTIPTDERRAIGRKVCSDINSEGSVLAYLLGIDAGQFGDARLTTENFSQLVGLSIATFCPQYMNELEDIANG
jgi:hypothetical protein